MTATDDVKTPAAAKKTRGLGRGLNALFEDEEAPPAPVSAAAGSAPQNTAVGEPAAPGPRRTLGITQLEPGPFQPRQYMDEAALNELAQSINMHGMLQPILVRPKPGARDKWEIVAGERRWRAAQRASLHEVPVVIREIDDESALEIGLIENMQRADLNPLEEAQGFKRLMDDFGHTQEKLAAVIGKSRSHIANMVRLLHLPVGVQMMIHEGKLSAGHARALVNVADPELMAEKIVKEALSVREAEKIAAKAASAKGAAKKGRAGGFIKDANVLALEKDVGDRLGMKVSVTMRGDGQGGRAGSVKVDFRDLDQLDEIIVRLSTLPIDTRI